MTRRPTHSQTVIDQASAWVVRLGGDEVSEADYLALEAWLALSPEHPEAFTEAEALWAALDQDRSTLDAALVRSAPKALTQSSPVGVGNGASRRRWPWAAAAMAVAAALVMALLLGPALAGRTVVYVTAPGEQKTISLADGSTINMNGGSRLSVRLTAKARLVDMGSAEAAFDVAHDASRPFLVTVGQSQVEVLGTAFDVRRDAATTRVSVARGVVRVSDLADPGHKVRLTAGQTVARADADGALAVTEGPVTTAAWQSRRLVYDRTPLSEVAADLSRAYPTPVRAVGGAEAVRFTGVLVLDDQASTLRRLETFLPVTSSVRDGVVELRPQ